MTDKQRIDKYLVEKGMTNTRSQAESYVRLGEVTVNGRVVTKAGYQVSNVDTVRLTAKEQYVSRAALKLASVAETLQIDFRSKTMLDVGSSTGGFTQYALSRGAKKVIAVDVGSDQLHPSLRTDTRIELHEQTDIRNFMTKESIDIVTMDVSFISLREVLPHVAKLSGAKTEIVAMVKPQFEAAASFQKHKGVIKNDRMRRDILKDFEDWLRDKFIIQGKADSHVAGTKGNVERFYKLKIPK